MQHKQKLTLGILGVFVIFALAIHFDFAGAMYGQPPIPTKPNYIPDIQSSKKISVKKPKKKKSSKPAKPQGTWHVVAIYNGPWPDGPFKANTVQSLTENAFDITFKGKGFCTTHWTDPTDETNTKPHCEDSLIFNEDGSFTAGRLQAWGGFMKFDGSQLEWYEGGMGYTKYVLQKKR